MEREERIWRPQLLQLTCPSDVSKRTSIPGVQRSRRDAKIRLTHAVRLPNSQCMHAASYVHRTSVCFLALGGMECGLKTQQARG